MLEGVDVIIITAAEGEDTALLQVTDGLLEPWTKITPPDKYSFDVYLGAFHSGTSNNAPLRVLVSRPGKIGPDHSASAAGQLVAAYQPNCVAMSGVCAGRPDWTQLGDVIIGDEVWRYDVGEQHNELPGATPSYKRDVTTHQIPATWLNDVRNVARELPSWPSTRAWVDTRPPPLEHQALWILHQFAEGNSPLDDDSRERKCPHWPAVVDLLKSNEYLQTGRITAKGREFLADALFVHGGRLPEQRPWAVHVGPMATGNLLVRDVDIWQHLSDSKRLVYGMDMEVASIGQVAWSAEIPFLVVKGVMDHALPERHRGFRPFAARAAAEVLMQLLRRRVDPKAGKPLKVNSSTPVIVDDVQFSTTPSPRASVHASIDAAVLILRRREGYSDARSWFTNWPSNDKLPMPRRVQSHPLLHTYVAREVDSAIEHDLLDEACVVGITGVVGMGGIGKSFLANYLAQRLIRNGYHVAWIGLLRKNLEGALAAWAEAFGLNFRNGLRIGEMQAAIGHLLRLHFDAGTKLVIVLDNAERFENLGSLLNLCQGFPTLVTSRRREQPMLVKYHGIHTLNDAEVRTYTQSFLDRALRGGYASLSSAEQDELHQLCLHDLGGHPLGILMALNAYRKLPSSISGSRAAHLRTLLNNRPIALLIDDGEMLVGTGGAEFSRSVQACFDWLYAELLVGHGPVDREAHVLLPLIASLSPVPLRIEELGRGVDALCQVEGLLQVENGETMEHVSDTDPDWAHALLRLRDHEIRAAAIDVLVDCSLIDRDDAHSTIQVHPLVREYAFHLRELAPIIDEDTDEPLRAQDGPTPNALLAAVQGCVSDLSTAAEVLLDLTPRLRRIKFQVEDYYKVISDQSWKLYMRHHRWDKAQQILSQALILVREKGVRRAEGRIMLRLGEIRDRCSDPEGRDMIRAGLELLEGDEDPVVQSSCAWARAYYQQIGEPPASLAEVREVYEDYRKVLSFRGASPALIARSGHLLSSYEGGLGLGDTFGFSSLSDDFVSNNICDLVEVLDQSEHLYADALRDIYKRACRRSQLVGATDDDEISQSHHVDFRANELFVRACARNRDEAAIEAEFGAVTEAARAAGLRSYDVHATRLQARLLWALEKQQWEQAERYAKELTETRAAARPHRAQAATRLPRILEVMCGLCKPQCPAEHLQQSGKRLDELASEAETCFDTHDMAWVELGRALHAARCGRGAERAAVTHDIRARRALCRGGRVSAVAEQFRRIIESHVDAMFPQYSHLHEELRDEVDSIDVIPWSSSRLQPLPTYVRSRKTGRRMRLVRGGVQAGPGFRRNRSRSPADVALYNFYIDELPFSDADDLGTVSMTWAEATALVAAKGLRLPNIHEWCAAIWQWRHAGVPAPALTVDDAIERIAAAVDGQRLVRYELPDTRSFTPLEDEQDWTKLWAQLFDGGWIDATPEVAALLDRLFEHVDPNIRRLIANSLCFGPGDLLDLSRALHDPSPEALTTLCEVLKAERNDWERSWKKFRQPSPGLIIRAQARVRNLELLAKAEGTPDIAKLRGVDFDRAWLESRLIFEPTPTWANCTIELDARTGRLCTNGATEYGDDSKGRAACLFVHPIFTAQDMEDLIAEA